MANLKADLDHYLSGSTGSKNSLSNLAQSFKLPTLKSPFSSAAAGTSSSKNGSNFGDTELLMEEGQQSSSWFGGGATPPPQNDCFPSLSKKQRILGFMLCLGMGIVCFVLASLYFPVLILYARKFALLFSMGSVFTLGSFSLLWGPMNHLKHLFGKERLPFTTVYLLTLFGTLYFAMGLQSTVLTVIAAGGQVVALLWFVISYIPGGQTGLKFFTKLCSSFCRDYCQQLPASLNGGVICKRRSDAPCFVGVIYLCYVGEEF